MLIEAAQACRLSGSFIKHKRSGSSSHADMQLVTNDWDVCTSVITELHPDINNHMALMGSAAIWSDLHAEQIFELLGPCYCL